MTRHTWAVVLASSMYLPALATAAPQLPRARVYPANPVATPELIDVELQLPLGATILENERVRALSCLDRHDVRDTLFGALHVCHLEHVAFADASGDFLHAPAPDTQPEDPFAELSLFYHADRALRYFATFGVTELATRPLTVVANVMRPPERAADASAPFEPLAGAYYSASEPLFGAVNGVIGPSLWFGQGPVTDYAYDADVIYHELVHAIVDDRIGLALWFHADDQGLVGSPGAINEAIADYFAAVLTGDAAVGEYAAPNLRPGLPAYRFLDTDARCPADLSGEAHYDSASVSSALWTVREAATDSERGALDRAVLDSVLALPSGDVAFEDWLEALLSRLDASAPSLTGPLRSELEWRALLPHCERVLTWAGVPLRSGDELRSSNAFVAPGRFATPWTANGLAPPIAFAPGILQVRIELSPEADSLSVRFDTLGPDAAPLVLVRWGDTPIRFLWDDEVVEVDVITPATNDAGLSWHSELEVPRGTSAAHVMVANTAGLPFLYRDLALEATAGRPMDSSAQGGCACSSTHAARATPAWLWALALLFGRSSRRKSVAKGAEE